MAQLFSLGVLHHHRMKRAFLILTLVCFSLFGVAADVQDASDQQSLQGTWLVESVTSYGHKTHDRDGGRYIFSGDKLAIIDKSGQEMKFTFKLDTTTKPKFIILVPEIALTNSVMSATVYELDGDSLKVATDSPATRRTKISGKELMVVSLKRK